MMQKFAIVFPGQGSQTVGMLDTYMAANAAITTSICQEASDVLGYDIADLISLDAQQLLNQTQYTQPAMLTAGVIAWRIWQQQATILPSMLAGHSLGEYTALVCANALTFTQGLKLVAKRGELMQRAVAPGYGAMAAILGLTLEQVSTICTQFGGQVQAANINTYEQIVIAGTTDAVESAIVLAKEAGAKRVVMLPVSVPSHCMLMQPAADEFMQHLIAVKWQKPQISVIHNYDVASHDIAQDICEALAKQLYNPVRWVETIEYFMQQGVTEILECGPGKVLTGMNKRIAPQLGAVVC